MPGSLLSDQAWIQALAEAQPRCGEVLSGSAEQQQRAGYFHTLREICQQPATWLDTAERMIAASALLHSVRKIKSLILTGSGSSEFVGACVRGPLRHDLGIVVDVIGGGALLEYGADALAPLRPALAVSIGRSGDSPESVGVVSRLLQSDTNVEHLVLTCNREGGLARNFQHDSNVRVITLADVTNDRSLVMTSSFTNLVLAARFLGLVNAPEQYRSTCRKLSDTAAQLLRKHFGAIAEVGSDRFTRAVYLGTGSRLGAARESALKMLEMTAGTVATLCESYLGLRHGPMTFIDDNTIAVCFLSSDKVLRAYETDLLRELDQKKLGRLKVIVGENIPREVIRPNDLAIDCPGLSDIHDDDTPVIHVVVGQLLAFFRCLEEGLHPDSPSKNGVINRVVPGFRLHYSGGADGNGR